MRAAGFDDLRRIVVDSVLVSRWSVAMRIDGVLACIIGLAVTGTVLTPVGIPWMLGTPLVPRHGRTLTRLAQRYIPRMLATTPHLMNTVHARNTVAVRWLSATGSSCARRIAPVHRASCSMYSRWEDPC